MKMICDKCGALIKICPVCNKYFATDLPYRKYCSEACKMEAEKRKDRIRNNLRFENKLRYEMARAE